MKLCLYNVENLFLLNHGLTEGYKKPLDKIEWIARTIKEIDADIYMLCEVGGLSSLDLFNHRHLNDAYYTALIPGNSNRGIEMGYLIHKRIPLFHQLLSHKEKSLEFNYPHELIEQKNHGIGLTSHRFSRDIAELRLYDGDKLNFIIFLVHLKSKLDKEGIDFNGSLRREAELKTLVKTYNERRSEFPHIPIVVTGDMNGRAQKINHEQEFGDLYKLTDLEDVLEVIEEPQERRFSYFHFNRDNQREESQLDFIFIPKALHGLVQKEESGIYLYRDSHGVVVPYPQDSFERYALPSDHYPIVLSLKI